jgi:chlorinating enzyme
MTAEAPTGGTGSLSEAEYAQFHRDGFLICPPVFGAAEMGRIRHALDRVLATSGYSRDPTAHRHLDSPEVYDLVAQPPIVDRIASLIGPDLLLWHTRFFDKPPGDGPVPWHQDMAFWPIDPQIRRYSRRARRWRSNLSPAASCCSTAGLFMVRRRTSPTGVG